MRRLGSPDWAKANGAQLPRGRSRPRATLSIMLVLLLLAVLAPLSPARATHDGSDPSPSAPNCEWYGSIEWEKNQRVDRTNGSWQTDLDKAAGWSGPSQDATCRGSLHYTHRMDSQGWSDGRCYFAKMDGTVEAWYEAYWNSSGGFSAAFHGDDPLLYESGWGTCSEVTVERMQSVSGGANCPIPAADTPEARSTMQAVVVTCSSTDSGGSDGETYTVSETMTIRMRRTVCDESIDTDGDDLADCTEFALQTEPHNPDTDGDGLTDGQEVLRYGTDPRDVDTDDGGVRDGDEVTQGSDPNEPTDDFANCRFMSTSFIAGWRGDFDIEQPEEADPLHWMRYSWNDLRYCVSDAGVRLATTGSQAGAIVLPEDIAYSFELLDLKMKYSGSNSVRVERLVDASLEARVKGRFKFCSGIPLLGPVVGKGIKAVLKIVPDRYEKQLLEWGPRRIFKSSLIPTWIKNEIVERGFKAVLRSFDSLSDSDYKAIMGLFRWIGDKVGGKLARLVLGDLLCKTVWHPEVVVTLMPGGAYDTFAQGPTGPFEVRKDF